MGNGSIDDGGRRAERACASNCARRDVVFTQEHVGKSAMDERGGGGKLRSTQTGYKPPYQQIREESGSSRERLGCSKEGATAQGNLANGNAVSTRHCGMAGQE